MCNWLSRINAIAEKLSETSKISTLPMRIENLRAIYLWFGYVLDKNLVRLAIFTSTRLKKATQ